MAVVKTTEQSGYQDDIPLKISVIRLVRELVGNNQNKKEFVMSISHYKNRVFMLVLMSASFIGNVACVRAASQMENSGLVRATAEMPKPIAGRNRRRSDIRSTSQPYPRANTDYLNVSIGTSKLRINVLSNDSGSYLSLSRVNKRSAKGGHVYIRGDKVLYIPPKNYHGRDSFWYTVRDRAGRRHSAKVVVCFCAP